MSRDVHSCTHWLRSRNSPPPPRVWTLITRALLVSKDRRHPFVAPHGSDPFYFYLPEQNSRSGAWWIYSLSNILLRCLIFYLSDHYSFQHGG
jgi:hypothetical protein